MKKMINLTSRSIRSQKPKMLMTKKWMILQSMKMNFLNLRLST